MLTPDEKKIRARNLHFKAKYGITLDQRNALYDKQKGRCAICTREKPREGRDCLVIDHNHRTHRIREMLCARCNRGYYRENPDLLLAASKYFKKHKALDDLLPTIKRKRKRKRRA